MSSLVGVPACGRAARVSTRAGEELLAYAAPFDPPSMVASLGVGAWWTGCTSTISKRPTEVGLFVIAFPNRVAPSRPFLSGHWQTRPTPRGSSRETERAGGAALVAPWPRQRTVLRLRRVSINLFAKSSN